MISVSDRFLNEQLKTKSGGERLDIIAYADSVAKNLTPYFVRDSLSRIEWRLEDELTAFLSPDAQISLWYDDDLWDWLNDNEPIRVEIYSGFNFEKIRKWWGYIDKDNLRKDSLGIIYLRIYSYIDHLRSIKTSDVFGSVASPVRYVSLRRMMRNIFDYLDIDDYTIRILPLDTYPNATTYVMSFLDTEAMYAPHATRRGLCHINNQNFFYFNNRTAGSYLFRFEFDADYTDITTHMEKNETDTTYLGIDKYDDDKWVLVKGYEKSFWYKNNGLSWKSDTAWVVDELEFFDADGDSLGTQAISTITISTYKYWPMAYSFKKFDQLNYYAIVYNGGDAAGVNMDRCLIRIFDATTHATVTTIYFNNYYHHPDTRAAVGYYLNNDYYFTFLNPNSDFTGNVTALELYLEGSVWHTTQTSISYTALQTKGQLESLGPWVTIEDQEYAFYVEANYMDTGWWTGTPTNIGKAFRQNPVDDPYQAIISYKGDVSPNVFQVRELASNGLVATTEFVYNAMPADYTMAIAPTYWRTYEGLINGFGLALDPDDILNFALLGNQFYPFVKKPPLDENENLCDTIRDLATAGCCIYHFPDNTRALFISRNCYDDTIYTIGSDVIVKDWQLTNQLPRRIVVSSGSMEVEVGDEFKALNISSDYIPDYDDNVGRAYGQVYRDFLDDNPYIIEMDTDFLIQYEPFDTVKIIDKDNNQYLGRLIHTVKEGMKVGFEIRGHKL